MTAPTTDIGVVDDESDVGTLKYLVAETDQDPWVAQNIHELLEEVGDLATTDVFLLMPDLRLAPVTATADLHDDDNWSVRLEPDGRLIEHVIYSAAAGQDNRYDTDLHTQYVDGWPDPTD